MPGMTLVERAQNAHRHAREAERKQVFERATELLRGFGATRMSRFKDSEFPLLVFADELEFAAYPDARGVRLYLVRRDAYSLPVEDRREIRSLEDLGAALEDFQPRVQADREGLEDHIRRLVREELNLRERFPD